MSHNGVLSAIRKVIANLARKDRTFRAHAEIAIDTWRPAEIPKNSQILRATLEAAANALGHRPNLIGGYGSNDASYIINDAGIPSICGFGPGDSELGMPHGSNENVSLDILVKFAKMYLALVLIRCCRK